MTNAQTEARASLWVPAKPEHAKLGWTYDFEQTERISNAAYEGTGYGATMEVVEFVMAEADRRHATALAAKDAELAELREADGNFWEAIARAERAEAQLAEALKALVIANANLDNMEFLSVEGFIDWQQEHRAARRAREAQGGGENG